MGYKEPEATPTRLQKTISRVAWAGIIGVLVWNSWNAFRRDGDELALPFLLGLLVPAGLLALIWVAGRQNIDFSSRR